VVYLASTVMTSNSQSVNQSDTYSHRLADIVGTGIGVLTLTLPLFIIAHYSPNNIHTSPQPAIVKAKSSG
jgi:lipopolysaccharide/colanic/teichoic acid biosynthesis glycosyltransferase